MFRVNIVVAATNNIKCPITLPLSTEKSFGTDQYYKLPFF